MAEPPPVETAQQALARWASCDERTMHENLASYIDVVRRTAAPGDADAISGLLAIMDDPSQTALSRGEALVLACELANERGAELIFDKVEQLRAELPLPAGDSRDLKREQRARSGLSHRFTKDGIENLLDVMQDHERILTYVASVTGGPWADAQGPICVPLIAKCTVAPAVRTRAIVGIIETGRISSGIYGEHLLDMLDSSAFPALRELVRSETLLRKFRGAAADALSYLGDEEIGADLEALRPAFRAESENAELYLKLYIWRIQVQHPPSKLLEYIASKDHHGYRDSREAAVTRAHKLGVDRALIREAVLTRARDATTRRERAGLSGLKKTGLDLNILQETDLPDVATPWRDVVEHN